MIFANIYNGIGNQLFTYAFIRAIQEQTNEPAIYFSRKSFERKCRKHSGKVLEYLPDYYQLLPDRMVVMNGHISNILPLIYRKCMQVLFFKNTTGLTKEQFFKRVKAGYICTHDEVCLCDDVSQLSLTAKFKYVEGFFQWSSVLLPLKDKLRTEISLKMPLSESAQLILQEMRSCESVCLHIRRGGDYLNCDFLNVCNYQYYRKGMDYIAEKVENPVFYIFSNDIAWVENNYEIPYKHRFVKENHASPFELELMRNCKHFIISNSSFSWWAQFLTENESAVVVAPNPWYADGRQCSLHIPHWHIIDSVGGMEPDA